VPPSAGEIRFACAPVTGLSVSQRVPLGLARTFQTTSVFPEFTLREQVLTACHARYSLTPAEQQLLDAAHAFAAEHVRPHAQAWDQRRMDNRALLTGRPARACSAWRCRSSTAGRGCRMPASGAWPRCWPRSISGPRWP